jgi:hypothetical protein
VSDISTIPMRHEERQFFAIRCCCQPSKVLGFLLLPKNGGSLRTIVDGRGQSHQITIKDIYQITPPCTQYRDSGVPVEWSRADESVETHEFAIYSEDRGEDFWLSIPGFVRIVTPQFISALLGPAKAERETDEEYWKTLR